MEQIAQKAKWMRRRNTNVWNCSVCGNQLTGYEENSQKPGMNYCPQCCSIMKSGNTAAFHKKAFWIQFYFSDFRKCSSFRNRITGNDENPALHGFQFCPQCGALMADDAIH